MNRFRQEYLKMRSSSADAPDMDAPATPADLHLLQQAEKAFGGHLPPGYQPLVQPAETVAAAPQAVDGPLPHASEIMDKLISPSSQTSSAPASSAQSVAMHVTASCRFGRNTLRIFLKRFVPLLNRNTEQQPEQQM